MKFFDIFADLVFCLFFAREKGGEGEGFFRHIHVKCSLRGL